jgi:limonene-1,2-epoxide hydrolase
MYIVLFPVKHNDMTTQQIAERLAALCEKGDFETAQKELYADNVISIEPMATPDFEKETRGKDAVLAKIKKFESKIEASYGNNVSEPLVTAGAIAFTLGMDLKMKGSDRTELKEICVYEVKDGKIISEQFFM